MNCFLKQSISIEHWIWIPIQWIPSFRE